MVISHHSVKNVLGALQTNFDGVVADSGGDFNTIQAADDSLDAADFSLLVRTGTYAGFTVSTDDAYIFLAPGTVITSAIVLSGDNIVLVMGPGCDIQGLVTQSGVGTQVVCLNACDLDGVLMSGNFGYFSGGGWDTLVNGLAAVDGIKVTGTDCLIENTRVQTTAGGANNLDGISLEAARGTVRKVQVVDSDQDGISILSTGTDCSVEGCIVLNADEDGIVITGSRARVTGNSVASDVAGIGIKVEATGDDSVIKGNISDPTGVAIQLEATGDDCVVVANRTDGAITDNSTGSTVADNDLTAF